MKCGPKSAARLSVKKGQCCSMSQKFVSPPFELASNLSRISNGFDLVCGTDVANQTGGGPKN